MTADRPPIEPIITPYQMNFLSKEQLDNLQEATLTVLEETGVRFPSEKALAVFEEHGAIVDHHTQIVKIPRDLVFKALASAPRFPLLAGRDVELDLQTMAGTTYFTNDGCGHQTVDFYTGKRRSSTKAEDRKSVV